MKALIKEIIIESPVGPVARNVRQNLRKLFDKGEIYDRQTIKVMKRALQPDSNCVDVGCHSGSILRHMLDLCPNGKHYAFEPIPTLYASLVKQFPETVKIYDIALSDSTGKATFNYVTSNSAYSGLEKRSYPTSEEQIDEITVKTELLDNIIPPNLKVDLIKIDVEGAEFKVLQGAVQTINRSRPIVVFEFGMGAADHYGTKPDDIYALLHDRCQLEISLMEYWLVGKKPLTRQEFNTQFDKVLNFYFIAYPSAKRSGSKVS